MRYLPDTNIISNITKPSPSKSLLTWMAEQNDDGLYISSLTVAKIRRGVLGKPAGKRRNPLDKV
jgi:predicted nucleic acid-binding protein